MRRIRAAGREAVGVTGVDPVGVGGRNSAWVGQDRPLPVRGVAEPDPAADAVGGQGPRADHLGKGPAAEATEDFELAGPVLGMAEAQREQGVLLGGRVDHRDAVLVAADGHRRFETRDVQVPGGDRQALAKRQAEQGAEDHKYHKSASGAA